MKKSLAERLLAEEVPNNKVPDGKEFPEWDKAGTPPSQVEESHMEPIVVTISDPLTNTETVFDVYLANDRVNRRQIISEIGNAIQQIDRLGEVNRIIVGL